MDRKTRIAPDGDRRPPRRRAVFLPCSVLVHGGLVATLFLLPGVVFPGALRESPPVVLGRPEAPPPLAAPPSDPVSSVVPYAPPEVAARREAPPPEPSLFAVPLAPSIAVVGRPRTDRLPPSRTTLLRHPGMSGEETGEEGDPEPEAGDAAGEPEIAPPELLSAPEPPYPEWARRRGIEGTVVLEFTVRVDGTVGEIKVVSSSGREGLDRASMSAVARFTFRPARRGDTPVPWRLRRKIVYRLERD